MVGAGAVQEVDEATAAKILQAADRAATGLERRRNPERTFGTAPAPSTRPRNIHAAPRGGAATRPRRFPRWRGRMLILKAPRRFGRRFGCRDVSVPAQAADPDGAGALDKNGFLHALVLWRMLAKTRDRRQEKRDKATCGCAVA